MNQRMRRFGWLLALLGLGTLGLWIARSPARPAARSAGDTQGPKATAGDRSFEHASSARDGVTLPADATPAADEGTAEEPIRPPIASTVVPRRVLRGYVLHRGEPVVGARLTLGEAHAPTILRDEQGVAPLDRSVDGNSIAHEPADGTTDAAGAFVLEFPDDLWWALQVGADDFPLTVFGPFPRARVDDPTDLVLELERGGAIEGHVRTEAGDEPRELSVVAADRWGFVWSTPVEADGSYRIEALAPGSYRVQPAEGPVASKSPQFWSSSVALLASNCIVRAEATTHLDLPQEDLVVLAGELALLGARPASREALLLPLDAPIGSRDGVRARAHVDTHGHFELRLARPDTYRLEIRSASLILSETVDLCERRPEWRRHWETGRLRVRVRAAAKSAGHAHTLLRYLAEDLGSTRCVSAYVDSFWTDEFVLDVPAGNGRLEVLPDGAPESAWSLLHELSVPPGGEIVVDYP